MIDKNDTGLSPSEVDNLNNHTSNATGQFDSESCLETLSLFRAEISKYPLLSQRQEQSLALNMQESILSILQAIVSSPALRYDFLMLLRLIGENTLKSGIFHNENEFHIIRREFNELTNKKSHLTSLKMMTAMLSSHSDDIEAKTLDGLLKAIDWPYALVIAFTETIFHSEPSITAPLPALNRALHAIFSHNNIQLRFPKGFDERHKSCTSCHRQIKRYIHARDAFVNHNLRLVFKVARRYTHLDQELLELTQEGSIGLIRAAEKYRADMGYRFSTYAHHWIDAKIRHAKTNLGCVISISADVNAEMGKIANALEQLKIQNIAPNNEKLSALTNLSTNKIELLRQHQRYTQSLDSSDYDDDYPLQDYLIDQYASVLSEAAQFEQTLNLQQIMINTLSQRERYILNRRMGCLGIAPRTIVQLGARLSISKERVRQIEVAAIEKIRKYLISTGRTNDFKAYLSPAINQSSYGSKVINSC